MRALQYRAYGGPEVLEWGEAPDSHAGAGKIRIAVRAPSVNPIDWKVISGVLSGGKPMEGTGFLGYDAAGVVDEVAEGVTGVSVGDGVFGRGNGTRLSTPCWTPGRPSRRRSTGRWPPRPVWPARQVNARFVCSTSPPATRCSSTVGRGCGGGGRADGPGPRRW